MDKPDCLIAESRIDGQYAVTLTKRAGGAYEVRYGAHIRPSYVLIEALDEFRDCVQHAAALAGFGDMP